MSGAGLNRVENRGHNKERPPGFPSGPSLTFPREVCEQALGHATGDATELAYRRSDALERRRALMDAWASFCFPTPADVVSIADRRKRS